MQRTGRREFLMAAGLTPVSILGAAAPEAALAADQTAIETLPVRIDVERLLDDHMQAALDCRHRLVGVKPGGGADRHEVHRPMPKECIQVRAGRGTISRGQGRRLLRVRTVHRGDSDARDRSGGARGRIADAPGAENADVHAELR